MRAGWCLYYKRLSMERGFDASDVHLWTPGSFFCASFLFVFVLKKFAKLFCLCLPAFRSSARKGLTSRLSCP